MADPLTLLSLAATAKSVGDQIVPQIDDRLGGGWWANAAQRVVGGPAGHLFGWYDDADEEETELIEALKRGEVDPQYRAYLRRQLGGQYDALREQLGQQFANRGTADSTFATRAQAQTYTAQNQAFANALASGSQDRMRLGYDIEANRNAQNQQSGQATAGTLFNIMDYNLRRQGLEMERNRITPNPASPIPSAAPAGGSPASAGGSPPSSLNPGGRGYPTWMNKSSLRTGSTNLAATGRSGFGQMRKPGAAPVRLGL